MNFGQAIEAAKAGKRIAREGWTGKNTFVFQQVPAAIDKETIPKMQSLPQDVKDYFEHVLPEGEHIFYSNQMAIVIYTYYSELTTVKSKTNINAWTPSISDVLAEDWVIL